MNNAHNNNNNNKLSVYFENDFFFFFLNSSCSWLLDWICLHIHTLSPWMCHWFLQINYATLFSHKHQPQECTPAGRIQLNPQKEKKKVTVFVQYLMFEKENFPRKSALHFVLPCKKKHSNRIYLIFKIFWFF